MFQNRFYFWAFLLILTSLRLILAARIGLTPDEAYYWVWSQHLQLSYLDHPPAVAWLICAGTRLFGNAPFGIRVFGPLLALLGSGLIVQAGQDFFKDVVTGRKAAILLNATIFLGLGSATMTPDTPLVFTMAVALFALGRLSATQNPAWWLAVGAAFGLGFMSKYTAVLPASACGLWWLCSRRWREAKWVGAGAALGLITLLPVLIWNAHHHWASFLKQGGRAQDWQPWRALQFLGELVGGQLGLVTPVVMLACVFGVVKAVRCADRGGPFWLLSAMVLLPTMVFVQHAFGGRVQANWPIVLYPSAVLLGARVAWVSAASSVGFLMTGMVYLQALTSWLPLSMHLDVVARQSSGWPAFAQSVEDRAHGALIATPDYALASILHFYAPHQGISSFDPRWHYLNLSAADAQRIIFLTPDHRREVAPIGWGVSGADMRVCRFQHAAVINCYRLQEITKDDASVRPPWLLR